MMNFIKPALFGVFLSIAWIAQGDQTDERLDSLFQLLQQSEDATKLNEVEAEIWAIWFQSGDPEVDSMMVKAASSARSGDLDGAESNYTKVIERSPEFSEGWNRRATIRYYREDLDGSLADIEQTLRLEPRHFGAIWGLGMILGSQQDYARAILAFERLLELKPSAADARPRIEMLKQAMTDDSV